METSPRTSGINAQRYRLRLTFLPRHSRAAGRSGTVILSDVNASRLSPRWAPPAAAPQPSVVRAGTTGTRGNSEAQAEAAAQAPDVRFRSHGDLCWPQGGRANPRGKHDAPHH